MTRHDTTINAIRLDFDIEGIDTDAPVVFTGTGWYSLDDDGTFYGGKFPTAHRIRIDEKESGLPYWWGSK